MSQLNQRKKSTFNPPPSGFLGLGWDTLNNLVRINADGTTTILITNNDSAIPNIIANKGIGTEADTPSSGLNVGDVYVTNDTFKIYTRTSAGAWTITDLVSKQLVTDTSETAWVLHQYNGAEINRIGDVVPPQAWIDFVPQDPAPAYTEGRLFYDYSKKAISYYLDALGVTVNLGQELLFRVYNGTASQIDNGTVITPDQVTVIGLADTYKKAKCRLIAVATHDIPAGAWGWATRIGQVGGLNTASYAAGQILYLGQNGQFATAPPTDGGYSIIVGVVDEVHATEGIITVDINITELTVEVTDTNGFTPDQKTNTTIAVVDGTRTFSISPVSGEFHFYQRGEKYEKDTPQSVVFPDTEGIHWFYFDNGALTTTFNPTQSQKEDIVLNKCFVATLYWNATDNKHEFDIFEERHGISMSPQTHVYLHITRGAQFGSGYGLANFAPDGNGSLNTHAQFSAAAGTYYDEDIRHNFAGKSVGDTIKVAYLDGANGVLRIEENAGFAVLNAPTSTLYWNEWTGSVWQRTIVGNNNFVLYHIFAANGVSNQIVSVMGQNEYATLSAAREGASNEISNIQSSFDVQEKVPIGTIIFKCNTAYTNAVKAAIQSVESGVYYVDWRTTELAQGVSPTSHSNLSNVEMAGNGVTQGHINDQSQDIYGDKGFYGTTYFYGDIIQQGAAYETHVQQVYTANDLIITRDGAVGGLGVGEYTGFQAKLYDGVNDGQLVFDKDGWARVGDVGNLKKLGAIEETPTNGHIAYWVGASNHIAFRQLTAADITDFDTEVANNSAVVANTAKVSSQWSSVTGGIGYSNNIILGSTNQAYDLLTLEDNTPTIFMKDTGGSINENFSILVNSGQIRFNRTNDDSSGISTVATFGQDNNVGFSTTAPVANFNTTNKIADVDGNDRVVSINGSSIASVLNLQTNINIDGGTVGGLVFTRTLGQADSHKNVAGIICYQDSTGVLAGGELSFWTKGGSAPMEAMRIDSSGKLGIGVSAPMSGLDYKSPDGLVLVSDTHTAAATKIGRVGSYHYDNTEEPFIGFVQISTSIANQLRLGGGTGVGNSATYIAFYAAADNTTLTGTEIMRVDSNGLGIGKTPSLGTLDVNGTGYFSSTVTATDFILSSDARLKENIKLIDTKNIEDINIYQFNMKGDKRQRFGVIAQELENHFPEMVATNAEGFKQVSYIDFLIGRIASLENRVKQLERA